MLIGLQKAVINSEPQNAVKSRKKEDQVRNDGYKGSPLFMEIEPRFSIDKLTGSDLSMGPFKEWFFANNDMYDMGRSAASRQSSWYRGGGTDIATHSDLALSLNIYA